MRVAGKVTSVKARTNHLGVRPDGGSGGGTGWRVFMSRFLSADALSALAAQPPELTETDMMASNRMQLRSILSPVVLLRPFYIDSVPDTRVQLLVLAAV
jgi:hypothetical protein